MRRLLLLCWLGLWLTACAGAPAVPSPTPMNNEQIISDAVVSYLREHGQTQPVAVKVLSIVDDSALAAASPGLPDVSGPAYALLRRSADDWQVLTVGSSFSADQLAAAAIPPALQTAIPAAPTKPAPTRPAPTKPADEPPTSAAPATPTLSATGSITGRLNYPSDVLPALDVYAIRADDPRQFYYLRSADGQASYTFSGIAPGAYHVLAYLPPPAQPSFAGAYTRAVPCGLTSECSDHSLIEVRVGPDEIVPDINLTDWYAPPGSLPAPPTGQPQPTKTP